VRRPVALQCRQINLFPGAGGFIFLKGFHLINWHLPALSLLAGSGSLSETGAERLELQLSLLCTHSMRLACVWRAPIDLPAAAAALQVHFLQSPNHLFNLQRFLLSPRPSSTKGKLISERMEKEER